MTTFSGRLKAAMAIAGIIGAAELSRRCKVSRQLANRWLSMDRLNLSAQNMADLSAVLGCRLGWLAGCKEGPIVMLSDSTLRIRAMGVVEGLPCDLLEKWVSIGEAGVRASQSPLMPSSLRHAKKNPLA